MRNCHIAVLAACLAVVGGQALAVNKCKDATGKVTYQEHPCGNASSAEVIKAAPAMDTGGGDVSAEERLQKIRSDNAKFDAMMSGRVMRGMTAAQVKNAWGNPSAVNQSTGSYGVNEQWVYRRVHGETQYIYFENGVVTSIQSPQ